MGILFLKLCLPHRDGQTDTDTSSGTSIGSYVAIMGIGIILSHETCHWQALARLNELGDIRHLVTRHNESLESQISPNASNLFVS